MRSQLYEAYVTAARSWIPAGEALHAVLVPGRKRDFICAGRKRQPVLLLSYLGSHQRRRPPMELQHMTAEFGVRHRVHIDADLVEDDFVVLSLRDEDADLAEMFCLAADTLTSALPDEPALSDIEQAVRQFVDLMKSLTLPSNRALAGLWAELWLMSLASEREAAVSAWHADPQDRLDFSFPSHFVEVKATELSERNHAFSYEQLRLAEKPIQVVSVKLVRASGGSSCADLVGILQDGLTPVLRQKLVRNVFDSIGSGAPDGMEVRFDESFAHVNLRVIDAMDVPVVVIPHASPISSVRFRVNLSDSSLDTHLKTPASGSALTAL